MKRAKEFIKKRIKYILIPLVVVTLLLVIILILLNLLGIVPFIYMLN